MTWLAVETSSLPERDAVLGLKPDAYERLCDMLVLAWQIARHDRGCAATQREPPGLPVLR